jgi:murein DD-endopeptidase MepM/ murein hydrolase activator NlpD
LSDRSLKIVLVPDHSESRLYEIAYRRLRILRGLAIGLAVILTFVVATWGYMAARVAHVVELEAQVVALQAERARFPALIRQINDLEAQYESLRALFAPEGTGAASELWLPPPASLSRSSENDDRGSDMPDSWPLTERGFVTQGLLDDAGRAHPGLDIAIPTGSYIRAAGAGQVLEVGDDPTYGLYVRIAHGNGYETLYAHASVTAVRLGEDIRKNEVIAFSGSTGRSTAPHLHFEVLLERVAVDPLELVQQP